MECCGQHEVCEKDSLLINISGSVSNFFDAVDNFSLASSSVSTKLILSGRNKDLDRLPNFFDTVEKI